MHIFQKLTPIKDADLTIYEDALDYVFEHNDVKNVAISGAYGAGKSSVIETYKHTHPHLKFLHISLAHFESVNDSNEPVAYDAAAIEEKVLNQLLHQIPPNKIPRTNFKVKQRLSRGRIFGRTVLVMLFVIGIAYLLFFDKWRSIISTLNIKWIKSLFIWTTNSAAVLLVGLLCVVLFGVGVYTVVRVASNRNSVLKRVKLQGNEIEVFEQTDDSYFDKHLNEVLYLFENADVHVIVFEDMDRYNSNLIFEKLREINTLVNRNKAQADKPPIRFFYLLRDDIFVSKDRTKFFDFIMPIVPVIDGSNSYDKFIEHFKLGGIDGLFDELFLQRLSLYVDDMRLLKNIYNEFLIYHEQIQSIELDNNRLLALITYKNIFPRDFSDLQLGKGFVYTLFSTKPAFVGKEAQRIGEETRNLQISIEQADSELLKSIDELDAIYFRTDMMLSVNNKRESQFPTRAEFIREVKANPLQVAYYNGSYGHLQSINVENEFTNLTNNEVYRNRRDVITMKCEGDVQRLESRIEELRKEQVALENRRLREIITKENIDDVFSVNFRNELGDEDKFEQIKKSQYFRLIKFLIRNGYIDETYQDYMTYFYENSLSRVDKIFLRSITDQVPKEHTYALKNLQMLVSRLGISDFERQETLNFDLLHYLLETRNTNSVYLMRLLQQLMETRNYEFIGGFLESQVERGPFVSAMNCLWHGIFKYILTESGFNNTQKISYAVDTLLYSADEDIHGVNEDDCLSTFISAQPSFLNIENPNVPKLIAGFLLINVRFSWIDYSTSNQELFNAVYKNDLFHLSFKLICLMLEVVYKLPRTDDFKSKNYTLVISKPEEELAKYVKENIKHYMGIVLENCDGRITDEEFSALEILNNPEVDIDQKNTYIRCLQTEIVHITDVNDHDVWNQLLHHGRVLYSEENILIYFFLSGSGLDSFLINFINSGVTDLNLVYTAIDSKYGDGSGSKFDKAVVTCGQLDNHKYESILGSLNRCYNQFQFEGLHADKISVLIRLGIIIMNDSNLLFMRENYPHHVIPFIVRNISKYTDEVLDQDLYDLQEMLLVLDEDIDDRFKVKLLELTPDELSIKGKKYSDTVKRHILNHNLDLNDLPFLLNVYSSERKGVRDDIKRIAVEHIAHIIKQEYSIDADLLAELLTVNQLEDETKKELFATCLPTLSREQVAGYLSVLRMDDFLSLFEGKRPKFEATSTNYKILSVFETNGWITRFEEEENHYRAIGRKLGGFPFAHSMPRES